MVYTAVTVKADRRPAAVLRIIRGPASVSTAHDRQRNAFGNM